MTDALISEQFLGIFIGIIIFETALIFGQYIELNVDNYGQQKKLSVFQKIDVDKIIMGLSLCGLAIIYVFGMLPFISPQPVSYLAIGLYWVGLTLVINGLMTNKEAFYLINRKLDRILSREPDLHEDRQV